MCASASSTCAWSCRARSACSPGHVVHLACDPSQVNIFDDERKGGALMSETRAPATGMSARTAATIENTIIGICIVALVLIFQPFSLRSIHVGCGLVVFGALAFNLVPLCEKGRPLRSLAATAGIVVIVALGHRRTRDPLRLALRRLFHPAALERQRLSSGRR